MATTTQDLNTTKPQLPPGPGKLPYVGNLLSLRVNPLGFLQQLQRTYGNMATIYFGRTPVVLLFRPEYVRYVLVEHPQYVTNQGVVPADGSTASEGLLTIDGEQHRQQRRAVQPAFHKKQVEGYASIIEQYTQDVLETWHSGDTIDMSRAMQELTLRIISKCLFSVDLSHQLEPLSNAFDGMLGSTTSSIAEDMLNIRIDNPLTGYGKRMAATRQLDMLIYTLIAQRRDHDIEYNDVLSMLMSAQSGAEAGTKLTDKQIHDHILTFLAAGHETTALSLAWTFYLLSAHPQVLARLQEEVRTVLHGSPATLEDLAKMPYLDWVLSESMRLYPPAWMQMRFVAQDFELDGVRLPAGTMLMLSQWVMHRLPEFWDDSETFRPERWDPAQGQPVTPGAYFPFGAGPRICIGMPFAQLEARLVLATVLQHYTPQTVPGYTAELQPSITLRPKHHLHTILLPANVNTSTGQWNQLVSGSGNAVSAGAERQGCRNALFGLFGL